MEIKFEIGVIVHLSLGSKWSRIIRPFDSGFIDTQLEICLKELHRYNGQGRPSPNEEWIVREATPEEIQWLEACEKEGRYLENPYKYYEIY